MEEKNIEYEVLRSKIRDIEEANENQRLQRKKIINNVLAAGLMAMLLGAAGRSDSVQSDLSSHNSFATNLISNVTQTVDNAFDSKLLDGTMADNAVDIIADGIDNISERTR